MKIKGCETKRLTQNFELHDVKLSRHSGEYNDHVNLGLPVSYYLKNYKHCDHGKFNTVRICTSGNYCMHRKRTLNIEIIN